MPRFPTLKPFRKATRRSSSIDNNPAEEPEALVGAPTQAPSVPSTVGYKVMEHRQQSGSKSAATDIAQLIAQQQEREQNGQLVRYNRAPQYTQQITEVPMTYYGSDPPYTHHNQQARPPPAPQRQNTMDQIAALRSRAEAHIRQNRHRSTMRASLLPLLIQLRVVCCPVAKSPLFTYLDAGGDINLVKQGKKIVQTHQNDLMTARNISTTYTAEEVILKKYNTEAYAVVNINDTVSATKSFDSHRHRADQLAGETLRVRHFAPSMAKTQDASHDWTDGNIDSKEYFRTLEVDHDGQHMHYEGDYYHPGPRQPGPSRTW